jgi:hypothetical protein
VNTSFPVALGNIVLLSALSGTSLADTRIVLYPETAPAMVASLKACASAASQESHVAQLEVVRYVEHTGRGNYEYWINAAEPVQAKTYCRTQRGQVAQFQSFDGQWARTRPARPQHVAQIASFATAGDRMSRTECVPPSSARVSLTSNPAP